jgi:hypothetical protein
MSGRDDLSRWLAGTLTGGTVAAVLVVGIGLAGAAAFGGSLETGGAPLGEVLLTGGPAAVVAAGLVILGLVPLAELAVAGIAFARGGERRYVVVTLGVLALVVAGVVASALIGPAGG